MRMLLLLFTVMTVLSCVEAVYYGTPVGKFNNRQHGIRGEVFAVDSRTVFIKGFSYDGQGPDVFFYAGDSDAPSGEGFVIANENGGKDVLKAYHGKNIVLTLPGGKTLKDVKWLSVWCRAFDVNFGEVTFPERLDFPRPQKIAAFDGIHEVKSDRIVVVDAQTFLIPSFSYDGSAPDAHFYAGKGNKAGPDGFKIADENGAEVPLKKYKEKTLVIVLPGDITVFDIVWCEDFFVDFGHVLLPSELKVPPSLRMLGIEPQTKLNCEILDQEKGYEVRWAIAGKSIVTQLVAKLDEGEYMSFGISGDPKKSQMIGGDVTVAWMDKATGQGFADDYYLDAKAQCAGGRGACPDENIRNGKNDVRLLNSAVINDFSMLTFRQPLIASGGNQDKSILTNGSQPVIWAIGPVNNKGEVSYHSKSLQGDLFLEFGRTPQWNCPIAGKSGSLSAPLNGPPAAAAGGHRLKHQSAAPGKGMAVSAEEAEAAPTKAAKAWFIPAVQCNEPEDGVFFAQIGPTGGEQGYSAITGHVGWGIAWYINGLLIPEINVVRGKTYTFVIEGGSDPSQPAAFHPFYITDDPEGGYEFKTKEQRQKVKTFAGVKEGNTPKPVATGRLCQWNEDPAEPASGFTSFGGYQRSLTLNCQEGQPGIIQWTPDKNTPDTVYYQCYTHRFLGWKINVVDADQCPQ